MAFSLKKFYRNEPLRGIIHLIGGMIFLGTAIIVYYLFFTRTAPGLTGGTSEYIVALVKVTGAALFFALIAALPYIISSYAAKETSPAWLFLLICIGIGIHEGMLIVSVFFQSESSTATLGIVYYSVYYTMIVSVIWAALAGIGVLGDKLKKE